MTDIILTRTVLKAAKEAASHLYQLIEHTKLFRKGLSKDFQKLVPVYNKFQKQSSKTCSPKTFASMNRTAVNKCCKTTKKETSTTHLKR